MNKSNFTFFVLTLSVLSSCSVHQRAKNLVRSGWAKIDKAVKLDPSVRDSAYRYRNVEVRLPGRIDTVSTSFAIDSTSMMRTLDRYDSLVRLIDNIIKYGPEPTVDMVGAVAEKKAIQRRLAPAFIRDSVYYYSPDSTLEVEVHTKAGFVTGVAIHRTAVTVVGKARTADVTYDASKGRAFYRDPWFISSAVLLILLLLLLWGLIKSRVQPR